MIYLPISNETSFFPLPKAHKIMKYTRPLLNRVPLQLPLLEKGTLNHNYRVQLLLLQETESKNMLERAVAPPPPPPKTPKTPSPATSPWIVPFPLIEMEASLQSISSTTRNFVKHGNKRRFDDTQIRSLETIFETESRPELRVKQQLANKLGLQPRQVAIWFQNKRARSKSKQIEHEYTMLKGSYDNLASKYESLKKENESLLLQVKRIYIDSQAFCLDLGQESNTAHDVVQTAEASSPDNRCNFECQDLIENATCNSQWWEF